jgi:uncharacterized protein YoxC
MLPLIQICIVVATLAVVAIAVAMVRALRRVERASDRVSRLTHEIRQWTGQANELTREARETLASCRGVIAPIRRVAERFEALGVQTADLSAAVLEEVESPLRTAVAVARGVRSGTAHLLQRLSHRFMNGRAATNGGSGNE